MDGSPWEYQNWGVFNTPEPNNSGNVERYVAIRVGATTGNVIFGQWFDVAFENGNVDGGALVKCCQSTNGDAVVGSVNLPFTTTAAP